MGLLTITNKGIKMTVLLKDGTVGKVDHAEIGDTVTVKFHDENGMPIEVTGIVEDILED